MSSSAPSKNRAGTAARTGIAGTLVAGFAFFDGVFLGAPIALLAASFRPLVVYALAVLTIIFIVTACCKWVDRRWDVFFSGNGGRVESRLETMRGSKLMRHPVAWIQRGSDRWYGLAAAVANPILVSAFARVVGGRPVGDRRIMLGAVAYAIPYAAMWTLAGLAVGGSLRAAF